MATPPLPLKTEALPANAPVATNRSPTAVAAVERIDPKNETGHRKGTGPEKTKQGTKRFVYNYRTIWWMPGRSARAIAIRTGRNVMEDDLTGRSAQLAYYFFLSLFPGLIFICATIGLVVGSQSHLRDHLLQSFATFLPPTAYALVMTTLNEVLKSSNARTALLSVLFAFWSATSGMSAAQDTLNAVFRVKETRPYWKSALIAFALTIVVVVLAMSALVVFFYGGDLVTIISGRIGLNAGLTFLWKAVQWPLALFLLSLVFAATYSFAPNLDRQRWHWITPGSLIGIVGWLAVSGAFRGYLHFFNHYSVTYGSLGAVIILLLWFYLSGFMLLVGAEVNAAIVQLDMERLQADTERTTLDVDV